MWLVVESGRAVSHMPSGGSDMIDISAPRGLAWLKPHRLDEVFPRDPIAT